MDQENSKGQDKRNWRERLGIGAQGNAAGQLNAGAPVGKDLPKISDNYRKETAPAATRPVAVTRATPRPVAAAAPAVKPAPMAPRANPKAAPPVAPDKLAERLRSQREASTKLAEQRVQVAKQRAETPSSPPPVIAPPPAAQPTGSAKPKFTFAEEAENKGAATPTPLRPSLAPPVMPPATSPVAPQLSPARPPLGGGVPPVTPGFPQRPQASPFPPQPPQGFPQQNQLPPGFPQGYGQQPVPPYRPIDPASGYAPPPGYVPQQRGFAVPPQQGGFAPANGPRLNMPPRPTPGLNANYQPQADFNGAQQPQPGGFAPPPRMNRPPLRAPVPSSAPDEGYDEEFFDEAPQSPRAAARPTSNDYQQAYREAEYGFDDETPRSRAPWILAGLLLLALLVAGLGVLGYQKYWKPMINGQATTQEVPAVAAPEIPAKVQAEQPAAAQAPAGGAAIPTKKQIYDRIVGDQEVLGGDVSAPAEVPAAIPEPVPTNQVAPPPAAGEDPAPLPIPPPPGGAGGQQGSLEPPSEKQSAEIINPAAGESQAAVVAPAPLEPSIVADPPAPAVASADVEPPAPGEIDTGTAASRSLVADPVTDDAEAIADTPDPLDVVPKKKVEKKKLQPTKEKAAATKLGAKPVVLVPPSKKAKAAAEQPIQNTQIASNNDTADGGLFGDDQAVTPQQQAPVTAAPVKKKRTLADLFSRNKDTPQEQGNVASVDQAQPTTNPVLKKPLADDQSASLAGDFVVQLASFRSRQEANAEFSRLQAKNGVALGQFSPIISEASVGGSTRFRLSVGRMSTQAQANAVCSKLFANGVRDCLVKKR